MRKVNVKGENNLLGLQNVEIFVFFYSRKFSKILSYPLQFSTTGMAKFNGPVIDFFYFLTRRDRHLLNKTPYKSRNYQ